MKNALTLLLCPILIAFSSINCLSQQMEEEFDRILTEFSNESPGVTALVAKEGKVIYRKSFGKANLELDVVMKPDDVFRIGSITKQFTATAILKLAEEGKLSLHDEITKFIPDFPTHGHQVRIEHLLTHTSGIRNYTSVSKWTAEIRRKDLTPKELIDLFKDEPMDFVPGEDYRYSNSGYILLGYIIEVVTGKPYAAYIDENFFQPLNMKHSYYDNPSLIIPDRVAGYQKRNGKYENADYLSMTLPYAAGSLVSNTDDLLTWYEGLMTGKVVHKASLEKAHTSYKLKNGRSTGYGYGWNIGNIQGSATIRHDGRVNGFVTFALYLPVEKIFVAILSNCDCTDNPEIPASKIAAMLLGKPYQWSGISVQARDMENYQGVYKSDYEGQKIIAYEDGRLLYFSKGGSKAQLVPVEKDKFLLENSLTVLAFGRNTAGKISSFESRETGLPVAWTRTTEEIKAMKVASVDPATFEKYVGQYQFSPGPVFSIVREGDKLYGQVGQDKKEIVPFDKHKFFARDIDARILFNLDKNGNVVGLTKVQSDAMSATKIE